MPFLRTLALISLFTLAPCAHAEPLVHVAIGTHNEDPGNADTGAQLASNLNLYRNFRHGIYLLAQTMQSLGIPWNCQNDWNFLEGCRQWEINSPQSFPDDTAGLNIVRWLREVRGVEIDAHSHEGFGYNYADVAWLLRTYFNVPDSELMVVGGHIYPSIQPSYQDWPKFARVNGDGPMGCAPEFYAAAAGTWRWQPRLLMGAGTPLHVLDGKVTGIWKPVAAENFFTHSAAGTMMAIGNAGGTVEDLQKLITRIESGRLDGPAQGKMRTTTFIFAHAKLYQPSQSNPTDYLDNTVVPALNALKALEAAGKIQLVKFNDALALWQTQFASTASNWPPQDCVSFHWNTQDFMRPDLAVAYFDRLLDLHEQLAVPVDVFLTETMLDKLSADFSAFFARLGSSAMVSMAYHVRPPKPYYTGQDIGSTMGYNQSNWSGIQGLTGNTAGGALYNFIYNYETHGLDLASGQPTVASGGMAKMSALFGHAPIVATAQADSIHAVAATNVLRDLGGKMQMRQGSVNNLGDLANSQNVKPEHAEIRLIEHFKAGMTTPAATAFDTAVAAGRVAISGSGPGTRYAYAPYFMSVKLHDNDLFSDASAWLHTYTTPTGRRTPTWLPYTNPNIRALLTGTVPEDRFAYYAAMLQHAATNRANLQLTHAEHILDQLSIARPPRVTTVSHSRVVEHDTAGGANAGAVVATLGTTLDVPGATITYTLVSGVGSVDNAAFTIVNGQLRTIAGFDHEQKSSYSVRVRATDQNGATVEQILIIGVANSTADDDDGDGQDEAHETLAGTNALDPSSVLRITAITRNGADLTLTWLSVAGKAYVVQTAPEPQGAWSDVAGSAITATGPSATRVLSGASGDAEFFRVRVQ